MKELYCFTKLNLKWTLPLVFVLAGCAHQSVDPAGAGEGQSSGDSQDTEAPELDPTSTDVMFRVFSGELLGSEGDMERAADEYLEAAMESEDPQIAARATRIAMSAQAWQHAAMASDRWVLLEPENIDARQVAARSMMVVGDYVGAEHHLNGIIEQMQHDPARAWALVTGLLTTATNIDRAGRMLNHLVADNNADHDPNALFARSQFLARTGELPRANDLAKQAIEADPERAEFHAWAGRIAVNLEMNDEAMDFYHAAWKLSPASQPIAMAYAQLLKRNGDLDLAQDVLAGLDDNPVNRFARIAFALDSEMEALALEIYAGFATAQYDNAMEHAFQAAQAAEILELISEAADWYEKVERGEQALIAALRRAYLTSELGDLESARQQLARLRLQHDSAIVKESFLAESEILVDADQSSEAHKLLTSALETHPGDIPILYGRAMIAVELERYADAESDLREIIEQDPQNAAALNALGYTLADRVGRYEEAEILIRTAYNLQPEEASIIDSMGWIAYRMGRLPEAEDFLRDALARDNNPEIAAHLGEVLWVGNRREEALEVWNKAVEVAPDNEVLAETMRRFGVAP
jgi:tetratricopeptide (TPR) repeat protein